MSVISRWKAEFSKNLSEAEAPRHLLCHWLNVELLGGQVKPIAAREIEDR